MSRNPNAKFSAGDAVKHGATGEVAVVTERLGRNRIVVSRENRTTAVWYAASAKLV